ncbi:MAG: 3-dehydroquinate synthase [Bacteroidota bacterium]|jgi:3-dehydroquinate synthase
MQYCESFDGKEVDYFINEPFHIITTIAKDKQIIYLIDACVFEKHASLFKASPYILIPSGEASKCWATIDFIIHQLLELNANRQTLLVGVGGGVVSDITGFVAAIYMRGIEFGFVPTTLLSMVDAAIGGKNGINFGEQKNLIGTFNLPSFILMDYTFLNSLPIDEFKNGFGEIIKYACLSDVRFFDMLFMHTIEDYQKDIHKIDALIQHCVSTKNKMVMADFKESHVRKLLNFGHTIGHAIEKAHTIPHGQAVGLGILYACKLSETLRKFDPANTIKIKNLLQQYQLPTHITFSNDLIDSMVKHDKKSTDKGIDFILLDSIGKPHIQNISIDQLKELIAASTL